MEVQPEPSENSILLSAIGWLGVIGLFALIVLIAYIYDERTPIDQSIIDERLSLKAEHSASMTELAENYQVTADGTVRIPVDEAARLVLPELQAKEVRAASPNP